MTFRLNLQPPILGKSADSKTELKENKNESKGDYKPHLSQVTLGQTDSDADFVFLGNAPFKDINESTKILSVGFPEHLHVAEDSATKFSHKTINIISGETISELPDEICQNLQNYPFPLPNGGFVYYDLKDFDARIHDSSYTIKAWHPQKGIIDLLTIQAIENPSFIFVNDNEDYDITKHIKFDILDEHEFSIISDKGCTIFNINDPTQKTELEYSSDIIAIKKLSNTMLVTANEHATRFYQFTQGKWELLNSVEKIKKDYAAELPENKFMPDVELCPQRFFFQHHDNDLLLSLKPIKRSNESCVDDVADYEYFICAEYFDVRTQKCVQTQMYAASGQPVLQAYCAPDLSTVYLHGDNPLLQLLPCGRLVAHNQNTSLLEIYFSKKTLEYLNSAKAITEETLSELCFNQNKKPTNEDKKSDAAPRAPFAFPPGVISTIAAFFGMPAVPAELKADQTSTAVVKFTPSGS